MSALRGAMQPGVAGKLPARQMANAVVVKVSAVLCVFRLSTPFCNALQALITCH